MRRKHISYTDRLESLTTAVAALAPVLTTPDGALNQADEVLRRAEERGGLSVAHTVVALAGATGSGKSSLTNALAGTEVTTVGARRPTTADPVAITWGMEPADDLLNWLGIDRRVVGAGSDLDCLVLVDLPDIDSIRTEHHERAGRLTERVDMLVWVLDPQKYADAVVHQQYLRPMARHAEVTVAVLNQIDTLSPADSTVVLTDLAHRLADDGLTDIPVLGVSARTGVGLDDLRDLLADAVTKRAAARARLTADLATAADTLAQEYPPANPHQPTAQDKRRVVEGLSTAAGVDRIAGAVAASYRHHARAHGGWPLIRWIGKFRADPLRRLHLGARTLAQSNGSKHAEPAPVMTASSNTPPSPSARAEVTTALRSLGATVAGQTPRPWHDYVREGALAHTDQLPDSLDQAVVTHPVVSPHNPAWFAAVSVVQWLWFALAIAGALWLGVIAVVRYLGLSAPWTPEIGPIAAHDPWPTLPALPVPTVLLLGGLILGILTAILTAILARIGAAVRRRNAQQALRRSVAEVAQLHIFAEVDARIADSKRYAEAIERARQ